jgi:hypothetical protein
VKTFPWRATLSALFSVVSSLEASLDFPVPRVFSLRRLALVVPRVVLFGVARQVV